MRQKFAIRRLSIFLGPLVAIAVTQLFVAAAIAFSAEAEAPQTAESLPPAVQWIAPDAVAVLEISQPKVLLSSILDDQTIATIAEHPLYKQLSAQAEFKQFVQLVRLLELVFGTDWRSALQKLLGGSVVVAVDSAGGAVLAIDSEDQKLLENLHRVLIELSKTEATKQGKPDRVASKQYRGATVWTFGGNDAHAIIGRRLLLTNRAESLRTVLDLRADPKGKSIGASPGYQAARRAADNSTALLYVNIAALSELRAARQAWQEAGDPWATLLLPTVIDALLHGNWLALALHVDGNQLKLTALADRRETAATASFTRPEKPNEAPPPLLQVPGQIASATLYRDLYRFYAAKDELFPQRTSGLIFFENMMGIFFSGRDLTEEVLKEFRPEIHLVVAQQQYDPKIGTPQPQIPAFAAVLRMRNAAEFSEVVEEAWQKAFGLVSFTRGQKAEPGLIMDRVTHRGVKFTMAYFSARGQTGKSPVDMRFNFRPALAMPGDWVILSSTDGLARDLIDALLPPESATSQQPPAAQAAERSPPAATVPPGANTVVQIDAQKLAELLRANREPLVRQAIVDQGKSQTQAELEQELVTFLLECAGRVRLALGGPDKYTVATLEVTPGRPKISGQPARK